MKPGFPFWGVILLILMSACQGGESLPDTSAQPPAASGADTIRSGNSDQPIPDEFPVRSSFVHEPRGIQGRAPMMVLLHPGFSTPSGFISLINIRPLADAHQFILLAPRATLGNWNSGAEGSSHDDVAFIRSEVLRMISSGKADPNRIWLVGMSSGAMMQHRLLCESADLFSAAAMVAGTATDEGPNGSKVYPCNTAKAVPILKINGLSDACIPFRGGVHSGLRDSFRRSVPEVTQEWAQRYNCSNMTYSNEAPGVNCESYTQCGSGPSGMMVKLCAVDRGGHMWPGASAGLLGGRCGGEVNSWNATQAIWRFVSRY